MHMTNGGIQNKNGFGDKMEKCNDKCKKHKKKLQG